MGEGHRQFELRVEIVDGDASLHRMFAALHRSGATINKILYTAPSGMVILGLVAPMHNAHKLVARLAREPTIGHVEILSIDSVVAANEQTSDPE